MDGQLVGAVRVDGDTARQRNAGFDVFGALVEVLAEGSNVDAALVDGRVVCMGMLFSAPLRSVRIGGYLSQHRTERWTGHGIAGGNVCAQLRCVADLFGDLFHYPADWTRHDCGF